MMTRRTVGFLTMTALLPAFTFGGEFDRLEGDRLAAFVSSPTSKRHERLTVAEIEALPRALRDDRSAFLIVKTGQGNYARVLVSQALRKPPGGGPSPAVPVLVLERFDTFEPGKGASRVARGQGLLLFDGFRADLDAGQVVPEGQGGDLVFEVNKDGASLKAADGATIVTLPGLIPNDPKRAGPTPGRAVVPADFAGRYKLQADGRWSGLLELQAGEGRTLTGRFRSEANGTSYEVKGEVAVESPRKLVFSVKFPRVEQEYEAYLFTEGKAALAGTFKAQEQTFGFYAVREPD